MPSGYTAAIQDGCSFNEFILGCAKAFGACIDMRDEPQSKPIPDKFTASDYHLKQGRQAKAELIEIRALTKEVANKRAEAKYLEEIDSINANLTKTRTIQKQYKAMLKKAKAWTPPSSEHQELKSFMIEQIESSMKFDDMTKFYEKQNPIKLSGFTWKEKRIADITKNIEYHNLEYNKECEHVAKKNQ